MELNKLGEYNIEEYSGFNQKFKDVTLDVIEGYMSFFQKSYQILKQPINHSLQEEMI